MTEGVLQRAMSDAELVPHDDAMLSMQKQVVVRINTEVLVWNKWSLAVPFNGKDVTNSHTSGLLFFVIASQQMPFLMSLTHEIWMNGGLHFTVRTIIVTDSYNLTSSDAVVENAEMVKF